VCYLAAAAVLLVFGRERVPAGGIVVHLAVLSTVAVATWWGRIPGWLRAWTPLLALLFLYSELPMLIRATGHGQFYDFTVISWETAMFGGQPAIQWALAAPWRPLSELLHAAYLSYYGLIAVVPLVLWFTRRKADFTEGVFVLMLTFVTCFVCYLAFPVEGPRYLWPGTAPEGPVRSFTLWLLDARSSRGTAFPSSHVAVATTQSILAWRYFRWRGLPVSALSAGLALGAVYGGFHYAVDVVAGVVLGVVICQGGLAVTELSAGLLAQAKATAPTNPAPSGNSSSTASSGTAST
jgi:membrane-associated phospholipid phosphatase